MRKLELVKSFRMENENPYIAEHKKAFPETRLTIYQMDLIAGTVDDPIAWARTIRYWAGNAYRGESVFKMLEYYEKEAKSDRIGEERESEWTPPPPCSVCGKEICFALHREIA